MKLWGAFDNNDNVIHNNDNMMIMKRLLVYISMAMAAMTATEAMAVTADPTPKQVRLADGSMTTIVMHGDERFHYMTTLDGRLVDYDYSARCFRLMDEQAGNAQVINGKAGNAYSGMRQYKSGPQRIKLNDSFPTVGSPKSLVILIQFSNLGFESVEDPLAFYTNMLNQEGFTHSNGANGSARDYFRDCSNGLFTPEFVVKGPVTLPHEYYYYGGDQGGDIDVRMGEAVRDACMGLDAEIDFSDYDLDGDGCVDNIYFFYAGGGQNDTPNNKDLIWPHSASLENNWGVNLTLDGVKIDAYACSNEIRYSSTGSKIPTGIGTFVHEFGHVLGLADHYDVTYDSKTFGLANWDVMASGSYNNNMHTPALYSAFEKAELGWLQYTELTSEADSLNVLPYLGDCNKAYRLSVEGKDNEFYILENRQLKGWDAYLPGHGMLVWHIDIDSAAWISNNVNVETYHQRVDIVEVDGDKSTANRNGDIMPGAANVTQYQLDAWDGSMVAKIDYVEECNDTIRMLLEGSKLQLPAPADIYINNVGDSTVTFSWARVGDARRYHVLMYGQWATNDNGESMITCLDTYYDDEDTVTVSGLQPESRYNIIIVAEVGSYVSAEVSKEFTTMGLAFSKRIPDGLKATEIGSNAFKVEWNPTPHADDYMVSICRHDWSTENVDKGYDFTLKAEGLPQMWTTSSSMYYSLNGYYGAQAPSLRLSNDGDNIIMQYPEYRINGVKFWYRSKEVSGCIVVESWNDGVWTTERRIDISSTESATADISLIMPSEKVRIRYERTGGYMVIDDIMLMGNSISRVPAYNDNSTFATGGTTGYAFSGLTSGTIYGVNVVAISSGEKSLKSDECVVSLPQTSAISSASEDAQSGNDKAYDMSGRPYNANDTKSKTLVIIKGKGKVVK